MEKTVPLEGSRPLPEEGDTLPLTAYELIDMLDRIIPARCIGPNERPEHAHRYAGKREMIDMLLEMKRAEQEERPHSDGA